MVSVAREASTLSLATRHAGFSGVVLIPLGRLQMSPIPLLARGGLLFHRPHPPTGGIHGTPKRRAEKANKAQEASQAQEVAGEIAPRPRPRFVSGAAASSTQTRPESTSIPTCIWSASPRTATPTRSGSSARARRSSGDRRVVEEVPR